MPNRRQTVLSLTLLCSLVFSSLLTILASNKVAATTQSNATPVAATAEPFISGDGIDSHVLARSAPAPITIENPHLILERLEITAGVVLAERTTNGPEILYVEAGSVSIQDSFGFAISSNAGEELIFDPGATYALTNDGFLDATVLRLSFGGITAATASPAPGVDVATPVAASPMIATLIDQPVTDLPNGDVTLFLADATFAPGAESGTYEHSGPLGLSITKGTLSVLSPSGVTGKLAEGRAAVLPAAAPLVASNQTDSEVSALFAGIATADAPVVATIAPTPKPTRIPTETPVPTATLVPTHTPIPTATSVPTQTPVPTPTLTPTPIPTTAAGTILQLGDTWRTSMALVTVSASFTEPSFWVDNYVITFTIDYQNITGQRVDGFIPDNGIAVYDDERNDWPDFEGKFNDEPQEIRGSRFILDPGEARTFTLQSRVPGDDTYAANVFLSLKNFGDVKGPKWGFTWDKTRILSIAPGVVDPAGDGSGDSSTTSSTNQTAAQATTSASSDTSGAVSAANLTGDDLQAMLPTTDIVGDGLSLISERQRSLDEVVSGYGDPADATAKFTSWGWKANAICNFAPVPASAWEEGKLNGVYVSIHELGSPAGAVAALDYSLTAQAAGTSLQEVATPTYGDYSRALYGLQDYGNEITLFVQKGNLFIRISAASVGADPTPRAAAILKTILAKA